ncbi:hypothetical protein BG004_001573 [Podila humilis]|nr:hypothetical protein BG004_001573 [Podila humilis]
MSSDSFMASFDFGKGLVDTRSTPNRAGRHQSSGEERKRPSEASRSLPVSDDWDQDFVQSVAPEQSMVPPYTDVESTHNTLVSTPQSSSVTVAGSDISSNILLSDDPPPWELSKEANESLIGQIQGRERQKTGIAAMRQGMRDLLKSMQGLRQQADQVNNLANEKYTESELFDDDDLFQQLDSKYNKDGRNINPLSDGSSGSTGSSFSPKNSSSLSFGRSRKSNARASTFMADFTLTHDHVPRLLVVLPWEQESWNPTLTSTHTFRLYFFCEYGDYSKMPNQAIPHNIHLAKHSGYNILNPHAFFKKFGEYLLTVMEILRREMTSRLVVVPSQGYLNNLDGIRDMIEGYQFSNKTFAPLVQSTMEYIQKHVPSRDKVKWRPEYKELQQSVEESKRNSISSFIKRQIPALGRPEEELSAYDLTELPSFLENGAEEIKRMGNMFRTLRNKYVCMDHYIEYYNGYASELIDEFVNEAGGKYDANQGTVDVVFKARRPVEQFYGALFRAQNMHYFRLKLDWEVSAYDTGNILSVILRSSLSVVEIDGSAFTSSVQSRYLGQSERFDPLIHLMVHSGLQSLSITNCPAFLERITLLKSKGLFRGMAFDPSNDWDDSKASTAQQHAITRILEHLDLGGTAGEGKHLDVGEAGTVLAQWNNVRGDIRLSGVDLTTELLQVARSNGKGRKQESTKPPILKDDELMTVAVAVSGGLWRMTIHSAFTKAEKWKVISEMLTILPDCSEIFAEISEPRVLDGIQFYRELVPIARPLKITFLERSRDSVARTVAQVVYHPKILHQPCPLRDWSGEQHRLDVLSWTFDAVDRPVTDTNAIILDYATRHHPRVLFSWSLDLSLLSPKGLKIVGDILARSNIVFLKLHCFSLTEESIPEIQKVLSAVNWKSVKSLDLLGLNVQQWMGMLSTVWVTMNTTTTTGSSSLFNLQQLGIRMDGPNSTQMGNEGIQWIVAIMARHSLTDLRLPNLYLTEPRWRAIWAGCRFSELETLDLSNSNFPLVNELSEALQAALKGNDNNNDDSSSSYETCSLNLLNLQASIWQSGTGAQEMTTRLVEISNGYPSISIVL